MDVEQIRDIACGVLLVAGVAIMMLGSIGVVRMPDVYTRAQAASKTSTLGLVFIFVAVAVHFGDMVSIAQSFAVVAFALLSVPVAAHMVARAAHHVGIDPWPQDAVDELRRDQRDEDSSHRSR